MLALLPAGGGGGPSSTSPSSATASAAVPQFAHVFVVVDENHSFGDVFGNPQMPYFTSLIRAGGLATQYVANAHPSLPDYFALIVGNLITFKDNFQGRVSQNKRCSCLNQRRQILEVLRRIAAFAGLHGQRQRRIS